MALRLALCVAFSTCVANDTFEVEYENATYDAGYRGEVPRNNYDQQYLASYDAEYRGNDPPHDHPRMGEAYQAEYQAAYDAEYNYENHARGVQRPLLTDSRYFLSETQIADVYGSARTQLIHMHTAIVSMDADSVERVARQCAVYHVVSLIFFILVALCFRARCVRCVCDMSVLTVAIKLRYEGKRDAGLVGREGRDCERAEALGVLKC